MYGAAAAMTSVGRRKAGGTMTRKAFAALGVTAATLVLAGCATKHTPGKPLKPGFNLFSREQDIELGREAARQVRQEYQVAQSPQLQVYVRRIGQKLARSPEAGSFPYEFTVLNNPSVNAFALPGGPVFINSGLITETRTEAELAGVIAHEMAHVQLRHGTNQVSKANLIQFPAALAGVALGGSTAGQIAQIGLGVGLNGLFLSYSREAESEADALGARIMADAGYNPMAMARFFDKLQAEGGARGPQFLSSHPNPGNREAAIRAEIATMPRRQYLPDRPTPAFESAKREVAALPPAPRTARTD